MGMQCPHQCGFCINTLETIFPKFECQPGIPEEIPKLQGLPDRPTTSRVNELLEKIDYHVGPLTPGSYGAAVCPSWSPPASGPHQPCLRWRAWSPPSLPSGPLPAPGPLLLGAPSRPLPCPCPLPYPAPPPQPPVPLPFQCACPPNCCLPPSLVCPLPPPPCLQALRPAPHYRRFPRGLLRDLHVPWLLPGACPPPPPPVPLPVLCTCPPPSPPATFPRLPSAPAPVPPGFAPRHALSSFPPRPAP